MFVRWLCTVLLLLLLPPNLAAQETYLVAYAGFAGFQAPVWAPKDLGLFDKYGFKGDVVLVPGSVRQIQAVLSGSIHFAQIDAATGVNAINQGADLVMFSGTLNNFPYSFVTQKEIRKPEDLAGKKIGTLAVGGAVETATFLALKAWNIPRQSVTIFPAGDSAARIVALSAKAIDGTMLSYPDINEALRLGMHELVKMPDVTGLCRRHLPVYESERQRTGSIVEAAEIQESEGPRGNLRLLRQELRFPHACIAGRFTQYFGNHRAAQSRRESRHEYRQIPRRKYCRRIGTRGFLQTLVRKELTQFAASAPRSLL